MRHLWRLWLRIPPPALAVLAAVVVAGLVTARWMGPWLTRPSVVRLATPVPPAPAPGALGLVRLQQGQVACIANVRLPGNAGTAVLDGSPVQGGAVRPLLRASVSAPGYTWAGVVPRRWPGGLLVHLRPPGHEVVARVCLRNPSTTPIVLNANLQYFAPVGSPVSTVDGKVAAAVSITLEEAAQHSRLSRLGSTIDHAVAYTWRPLTGGLGRLLALLAVLLVPIGSIGALWWAMRADRRGVGPQAGGPS